MYHFFSFKFFFISVVFREFSCMCVRQWLGFVLLFSFVIVIDYSFFFYWTFLNSNTWLRRLTWIEWAKEKGGVKKKTRKSIIKHNICMRCCDCARMHKAAEAPMDKVPMSALSMLQLMFDSLVILNVISYDDCNELITRLPHNQRPTEGFVPCQPAPKLFNHKNVLRLWNYTSVGSHRPLIIKYKRDQTHAIVFEWKRKKNVWCLILCMQLERNGKRTEYNLVLKLLITWAQIDIKQLSAVRIARRSFYCLFFGISYTTMHDICIRQRIDIDFGLLILQMCRFHCLRER